MKNSYPGIGLILKLFSFSIASWLLIHILGLFGIFMAVTYPLWYLFFPSKSICFICTARQQGRWCYACGHRVNKENLEVSSLGSAFINAGVVILVTLFSVGFIYLESRLLNYLGIPATPKTASFVIPQKAQYEINEIFPLNIQIQDMEVPINTVRADLLFDPTQLEVVEINTSGSFANIFLQKEFDNEKGYVRIAGGLPNPGFTDRNGLFGTVYFRGKKVGLSQVEYLSTSLVLANDGKGTNVLRNLGKADFLILPQTTDHDDIEQNILDLSDSELQDSSLQITFYENEQVLGESTEQKAEKKSEAAGEHDSSAIFDRLASFDEKVLELWEMPLELLKKLR